MKLLFLILSLAVLSDASLLQLSQTLWRRLLDGGIEKVGPLDPLRVPAIKVDQSEGNTSYRVTLRDVEIVGLNDSTLESIHLARGKLRSNFSEVEAGYVTYTNLRDVDTIRYRFHTMVQNNRQADQKTDEIDENRNNRFGDRFAPNDDSKDAERRSNFRTQNVKDCENEQGQRFSVNVERNRESAPGVQLIYTQKIIEESERDTKNNEKDEVECLNDCRRLQDPRGRIQVQQRQYDQRENPQRSQYEQYNSQVSTGPQYQAYTEPRNFDESSGSSRQINQKENYRFSASNQNPRQDERRYDEDRRKFSDDSDSHEYRDRISVQMEDNNSYRRFDSNSNDRGRAPTTSSFGLDVKNPRAPAYRDSAVSNGDRPRGQFSNRNDDVRPDRVASQDYSENLRSVEMIPDRNGDMTVKFIQNRQQSQKNEFSSQNQKDANKPFVDIVYADEKPSGENKRVENYKVDPENLDVKVYGLSELMKDLRDSGRYIVHNFTKGEALTRRNDLARVAEETKKIKDLLRYARNHTEEQGYFEEGMELIYHYGADNQTNVNLPRTKRAHRTYEKEDDDVMHVILRIHVPVLRVKANYLLTGVVANKIVRGNGVLDSTFTDLIGDFMIELKKAGEDSMVVRAARAKLFAKYRNVELEGMDKKGPVDDILVHGLMAAEAVAAMIVDDLATKALSERTTDATVYKMYKDLPIEGNK